MKLIVAIIQPTKLEAVKEALTEVEVVRLTVMDCQGFGRQKGQTEIYRGAEYEINFLPKIKIDLALPDELADKAVEAIQSAASTQQIGDGKIFVFDIEKAVRIRTGEKDNDAL